MAADGGGGGGRGVLPALRRASTAADEEWVKLSASLASDLLAIADFGERAAAYAALSARLAATGDKLLPVDEARIQLSFGRALSKEDKQTYERNVQGFLHQHLARLPRKMMVRTAIIAGLACAGMGVLGAVGGYLAGRSSVAVEVAALNQQLVLDPGAGQAWLDLIRTNPDPRPALSQARRFRPDVGGEAASPSFWLTLPPPIAPQRR